MQANFTGELHSSREYAFSGSLFLNFDKSSPPNVYLIADAKNGASISATLLDFYAPQPHFQLLVNDKQSGKLIVSLY